MIAIIGEWLVWGMIIGGSLFGLLCAVIGFMFLTSYKA